MQPLTLEYIAGFVDGEGCFTIISKGERGYQPRIDIGNTNLQILKEIQNYFSLRLKIQTRHRKNPKWKTLYMLSVRTIDECKSIATLLEPYLRLKQEQAQIIMQYPRQFTRVSGFSACTDSTSKLLQQKLHDRIKILNKTGPPTQGANEDLQQETDPQLNLLDLKQKEITKP